MEKDVRSYDASPRQILKGLTETFTVVLMVKPHSSSLKILRSRIPFWVVVVMVVVVVFGVLVFNTPTNGSLIPKERNYYNHVHMYFSLYPCNESNIMIVVTL